jgi:hypothetical protein
MFGHVQQAKPLQRRVDEIRSTAPDIFEWTRTERLEIL